jgi:hypothetical protein
VQFSVVIAHLWQREADASVGGPPNACVALVHFHNTIVTVAEVDDQPG